MSDQLEDLTPENIVDAAIHSARLNGYDVSPSDCRIEEMRKDRTEQYGRVQERIPMPVWQWRVYITPNPIPYVIVTFLSGNWKPEFHGLSRS